MQLMFSRLVIISSNELLLPIAMQYNSASSNSEIKSETGKYQNNLIGLGKRIGLYNEVWKQRVVQFPIRSIIHFMVSKCYRAYVLRFDL